MCVFFMFRYCRLKLYVFAFWNTCKPTYVYIHIYNNKFRVCSFLFLYSFNIHTYLPGCMCNCVHLQPYICVCISRDFNATAWEQHKFGYHCELQWHAFSLAVWICVFYCSCSYKMCVLPKGLLSVAFSTAQACGRVPGCQIGFVFNIIQY